MNVTSFIKGIFLLEDLESGNFSDLELNTQNDYDKYIITQLIYYRYLAILNSRCHNNNVSKSKHKGMLLSYAASLISNYNQQMHKNKFIVNPLVNRLIENELNHLPTADTLLEIINSPYNQEVHGKLIITNMTSCFFIPLINSFTNSIPLEYKDKNKYKEAVFLYPTLKIIENKKTNEPETYIALVPITFDEFKLNVNEEHKIGEEEEFFFNYFSRFNLKNLDLEAIILLLSNFAFEHIEYSMVTKHVTVTVSELCKDIVLNNKYIDYKRIDGLNSFIKFIEKIYKDYRIEIYNNSLFSELVKRTGQYSEELVQYFQKSTEDITAYEVEKFRKSVFSEFLPDKFELSNRLEVSMATDEIDDESELTEGDDVEESSNEFSETQPLEDETDESSVGDDFSEDVPMDDENEISDSNKPKDDILNKPWELVFEFAKTETMQEYVLRKRLKAFIQNILNSDIDKYSIDEIFMLKKWNSEWINLVSTQTTKQFLNKLSTIRFGELLQ